MKDWKLLWPMVLLVTAIQIGLEWAIFSAGLFGEDPAAGALLRPLTLAWLTGIAALAAAAVHQDAIPGIDQDWLIRPLRRTDLLLAKLAFVGLTVSVPMFALNLMDALASGFTLLPSLTAVLSKETFVFACFVLPVVALAATTRNMTELIVMGAALVVTFASSVSVSAFFLGADWCPTCNSGVSWLQHIVQHTGILAGALIILGLQFYRRRSDLSRALAIAGAASLAFVQLSWNTAFAVETWMTRAGTPPAGIRLELDEAARETSDAPDTRAGEGPLGVRQATRSISRGRLGGAVEYMRRRARPGDAPVAIDLPVRAYGVAADELLLADRAEFHAFGGDGRLIYRGDNAGALAGLLTPLPASSSKEPGITYQTIEIPGRIYKSAAAGSGLQIHYSLTLMKLIAEHELAAVDGELKAAGVGRCATSRDRNTVYVRCKTIEQAPFCYSAALYGPGGKRNPDVLKCTPDYRRHFPAFMNVLALYGIDLPLRDRNGVVRYEIDGSDLSASYVLLRIYGEFDHFGRTLAAPATHPPR